MTPVFINNSAETFTPTQSGALATIIYECCLVAQGLGERPLVFTRAEKAAPFEWEQTHLIAYPRVPKGRAGTFLMRADRKLFGWRHFRQREYADRVVAALRKTGAYERPLILQNDPEMACIIRQKFPQAVLVHWFQNQHGAKEKFRRRFGQAVDRVAAVSSFTARWIEEHYELPNGSVRVVHNGVNVERFRPAAWNGEKPVINFVGRTGTEKAPDVFLKACIGLAQRTKNFGVQLLGANHWGRLEMDDYQRELSRLAEALMAAGIELRRPGHVTRPALPAELQRAQIHIVPSRWEEPCALTLLEGMATGLAVVASRTGGTPEVIGEAGILFERDNVEELTAHMARLLADENLRRHHAEMGRKRAEQLTWAHTWNGLCVLAREATGRPR